MGDHRRTYRHLRRCLRNRPSNAGIYCNFCCPVAYRDFESFDKLPEPVGEPLDCSFRCALRFYWNLCCADDACRVLDRGTVAESSFRSE